jgi:ABC-type multidrug transport system fused ATPase/permease subunit
MTAQMEQEGIRGSDSLKRLFSLLRPFLLRIIAVIFMMLAVTGIGMIIPAVAGKVIDSIVTSGSPRSVNLVTAGMVALIALMCALNFVSTYWLYWTGGKFLNALRERIFDQLMHLSQDFFQKRQVGELNARVLSSLEQIEKLITFEVIVGMQGLIRLVGVGVILVVMNLELTVLALIVALPVILVSPRFGKAIEQAALKRSDALAQSSAKVEEVLSGIGTVQAFNQERVERTRYAQFLDRLFRRHMELARFSAMHGGITEFFGLLALVAIVWYGGGRIVEGSLTIGALTSCMIYLFMFVGSTQEVSRLFSSIKTLTGASHRFFEILDEVPMIQNRGTHVPDRRASLPLEFDRVAFAYPANREARIFDDLSVQIRDGEVVALVGPSGSGKSTLFKLLMRFYDADSGAIRVGGIPVESYELGALRDLFGLVPQEIFLFSGTILDNIRYGNADASTDDVMAALEAVDATDFVSSFERGLEEQVGVAGSRLSVGQKQRLGLARVYLKNPRILILDEPTSALDSESEAKVQKGLAKLKQGRTTIVIAHRLATVREAHRILMLEKGKLIAEGDHAHLRKTSSLYSRYWQWQSSATSTSLPEKGAGIV